MNRQRNPHTRGSVLIVALVILLVLTLLGISGMNTTLLQERMVGNMQESLSAFQAAEAGLRDGERDAGLNLGPTTVFSPNCTNGLCEPADPASRDYDVWVTTTNSLVRWDPDSESDDVNTRVYGSETGADPIDGLHRQPAYIIERLQVVDRRGSLVTGYASQQPAEWYRVTSRGFGRDGQSFATVQSVIRK